MAVGDAMRTFETGLAAFGGSLARFLFPPVCPGCRMALAREAAVCAECWSQLRFIERPYCEVLGLPFTHDLGRGFLSAEAIADPPPFERLRAAVLYDGLAVKLLTRLKYGDRTDLLPLLGAWTARAGHELIAKADVVIPVPLHRRRLWRRRFNQSSEIARRVARSGGLEFSPLALERIRPTTSQVGLGKRQRMDNVRGAFAVPDRWRHLVEGRRVLLVDDVYTTGATAKAATRALMRAKASAVDVLVFARVAAAGG